MRYYIDRIEDGIAVMDSEGGERITVPVGRLPDRVRDGSVLILMPDGVFLHDCATETERRRALSERFSRLKNRNKE